MADSLFAAIESDPKMSMQQYPQNNKQLNEKQEPNAVAGLLSYQLSLLVQYYGK